MESRFSCNCFSSAISLAMSCPRGFDRASMLAKRSFTSSPTGSSISTAAIMSSLDFLVTDGFWRDRTANFAGGVNFFADDFAPETGCIFVEDPDAGEIFAEACGVFILDELWSEEDFCLATCGGDNLAGFEVEVLFIFDTNEVHEATGVDCKTSPVV